ncbi:MAG: hypothetical protein D6767_08650 [Candidatus Hydrogenedentota bacterium]|nr:MAG: hypothetical protein D6767_08650 [Candidatus Hydrogenedentota bacterium]
MKIACLWLFTTSLLFATDCISYQQAAKADITSCMEYLLDPALKYQPKNLIKSKNFQKLHSKTQNLGYHNAAVWFRGSFLTDAQQTKLLVFDYPILQRVQLWLYHNSKLVDYQINGLEVPIHKRQIQNRHIVFPISLPKGKTIFLIQIQSGTAIRYKAALLNPSHFAHFTEQDNLIYGIFSGIMIIMFLYNLFLFVEIREKSYLYYSLYVLSHLLCQLSYTGYAAQYLWPFSTWWSLHSIRGLFGFLFIFALLFTREFLNLKEQRMQKWIYFMSFLAIVQLVYSLCDFSGKSAMLLSVTAALFCILLIAFGVYAYRKKEMNAKYYLVAWSFFLVSSFLMIFEVYGLLPNNLFFNHVMLIGSGIEVTLLSLALANQINILKNKEIAAKEKLLEQSKEIQKLQDEINRRLEEKVRERTAVILKQQEELENQIQMARSIQHALLPKDLPILHNAEVYYLYKPMMQIGGDFLDILVHDDKLGLFLCDVSGHGVPSALLASMVKISLMTWRYTIEDPVQTLKDIEDRMRDKLDGNFLTAQVFCIHLDNSEFSAASAGHLPFFIKRHNGGVERIKPAGGIISDYIRVSRRVMNGKLQHGDRLVCFTDGVIEARNNQGEEYGENIVCEYLDRYANEPVSVFCNQLFEKVTSANNTDPEDDIAILAMDWKG